MAWRAILAGRGAGVRAVMFAGLLAGLMAACAGSRDLQLGRWHAWLQSPGGPLPFGLELERSGAGLQARVLNGEEDATVDHAALQGRELHLVFDHFASEITARLSDGGDSLSGEWVRRSGPQVETRLPFEARLGEAPRFAPASASPEEESRAAGTGGGVDGRWLVTFASDDDPSVGIFATGEDGAVTGTFLTTAGDYRYLAGNFEGDRLRLSAFDGSHAFLFDARLRDDGTLAGDFWSRDVWHDTWTARLDPEAELPDGFDLTEYSGKVPLEKVVFPGVDGVRKSLADAGPSARARLIEIFGSWCPNCNDAAAFMSELETRYAPRGLAIVGLAFEMTGDFEKDARQVRIYSDRYHVTYPILIAGTAKKEEASKIFPALDRVRAFPTFIFLDGDGDVKAVYSGFSGPATGGAFDRLKRSFEAKIEELLGPEPAGPSSAETGL